MCSGCISLYSYIKPQLLEMHIGLNTVVYLYIPTSNHNQVLAHFGVKPLYIFIFLHQTTTDMGLGKTVSSCISLYSYIKPQLIGFIYPFNASCISLYSYIKPQLIRQDIIDRISCISLYSYIKPQPALGIA